MGKRTLRLFVGILTFLFVLSFITGCGSDESREPGNQDEQEGVDSQNGEQTGEEEAGQEGFELTFPKANQEGISPSSFIMRWEEVENAVEYHIVIAEDEEFKNIAVDAVVESNRYAARKLKGETTYYWKVTAKVEKEGKAENIENKGGIRMFKTGEAPQVVEQEPVPKPEQQREPIDRSDWIKQIKEEWVLTFYDDFDGDEIDFTKWSRCPEWERVGGACRWSDKESFVDGKGNLIIQVSERNGKYYSGAIRSINKFEQAYGYFEIRCQLQKEEGFWGAFWLMSPGVNNVGNDGRDGTEIDIMESAYLSTSKINHALHWDGYGDYHKSEGVAVTVPGIYEGFHTFALEWNKDEYIFYIDGYETWRSSAGGVSQVPAYLKITAEVGSWAGNIKNAKLPDAMIVDYVKVYQNPAYME